MSREAIECRRQRACEAFDVSVASSRKLISECLEEAIEAATRVKITDEAIDAASREYVSGVDARNDGDMHGAVRAALAELGFEVEV